VTGEDEHLPETGWYEEPRKPQKERLWNGTAWTAWTRPARSGSVETNPAGWRPHPSKDGLERLWSGTEWTTHERPAELEEIAEAEDQSDPESPTGPDPADSMTPEQQAAASGREDIEEAFWTLDGKGQNAITGIAASRPIRKAFQKLSEFLPDDRVLALASAMDPPVHAAEQRELGAGRSLAAITQTAKSGRLLVVTETDFWQIRGGSRLNGGRPEGVRIGLAEINDVRTRTDRRIGSFGAKERHLAVDYLHGAVLETDLHLLASDVALDGFASTLVSQVQAFRDEAFASEQSRRSVAQSPLSVADELTKLLTLRDSGILTSEEYEAQKAKLLDS
jgi:hypothetical protein